MTGAKRIAHWGPTCQSGRHFPPHPGDTCDQADEWIAYRDARLEELLAAAMCTPMTEIPPALRGPNWKPSPSA